MDAEKRRIYDAVVKTYTSSLDEKKLTIIFNDLVEFGTIKKMACFLEYNQFPLHELDRLGVDFAVEVVDDSTGDTILILTRQDIEFHFWKYDDGALGSHYVLKSIEPVDDQDLYSFRLGNLFGDRQKSH